jgi:hypothetical protein
MRSLNFSIDVILPAALGSIQALTKMGSRNSSGGKACKADNITAIYEPTVKKNVGSSTSHNTTALHGLLQQ